VLGLHETLCDALAKLGEFFAMTARKPESEVAMMEGATFITEVFAGESLFAPPADTARTSDLVMRPEGPVPCMPARLTPLSAASLRATEVARPASWVVARLDSCEELAAFSTACSLAAALLAGRSSSDSPAGGAALGSTEPITSPTFFSAPESAVTFSRPVSGAGTSSVT
jgi:hypothetical protein